MRLGQVDQTAALPMFVWVVTIDELELVPGTLEADTTKEPTICDVTAYPAQVAADTTRAREYCEANNYVDVGRRVMRRASMRMADVRW
jgi:hypothetical protein